MIAESLCVIAAILSNMVAGVWNSMIGLFPVWLLTLIVNLTQSAEDTGLDPKVPFK